MVAAVQHGVQGAARPGSAVDACPSVAEGVAVGAERPVVVGGQHQCQDHHPGVPRRLLLALGIVFAAYASEVFLGAFQNLKRGQFEAARALALPRYPTVVIVILPQFLRMALPGLANLWLILLKDTSLISVIALDDLMRQTYIARRRPVALPVRPLAACLIYLLMSIVSSFGIGAIERWSERGLQRRAA